MSGRWLENKRIVIIGGTTGIGLSAARSCIVEGAQVLVTGLDESETESVAKKLGENALALTLDACLPDSAAIAIRACVEKFGGVDGLYHVAGGSGRRFGDGPLDLMTEEGWQKTMNWNLDSLMYSNKSALQYFLATNQPGVILNMSSVLARSPSPHFFTTHAYATAKSAVIGLSKSIASYYAEKNIRVNVIAPGLVETPMSKRAIGNEAIMDFVRTKQPLDGGRQSLPADLDGAAVFLLSDRSAFVTGQVISIDGGWSVSDGQFNRIR